MERSGKTRGRQPEGRAAIKQMRHALTAVRGVLDEELRPRGVTTAQLQALYQIKSVESPTGARLARSCSVTPQTMQTFMARSERAGWVQRGRDPENERLVLWTLTAAGHRLLQEVEADVDRVQERFWKGVSLQSIRELQDVLTRCLRNLSEE